MVQDVELPRSSFGHILKSTVLVGGSQVINIAIGIVRTKAMAILLGPAGFGLAGLYTSVIQLTQSVAGMGVNQSGVRQIARAVGTNDDGTIARTAFVLRRTSLALGLLGAVTLLLFGAPIGTITFGNDRHTSEIAVLGIAVFLNLVSAGQMALLQGTRRIRDIATINILGAFLSTVATIPLIYFLRERGVVPSLVMVAGITLLTSWLYSRKTVATVSSVPPTLLGQEVRSLLRLGFAFMASGVMVMGSAYLVRLMLLRTVSLEATGFYNASWTLSGLYVGFVLQAMGMDFYPRLAARANDDPYCNRLVNEQAHVSMLLAGPGVLFTLILAPLVIAIFYASNFGQAVGVLRWTCLGIALRVISWPMGFIIVAKGRQELFVTSEVAWTVVHLGLAWIFIGQFGLDGAGIAFFASYIFHVLMTYFIVRRISGYRWSTENVETGFLYLAVLGTGFSALTMMTPPAGATVALCLAAISLPYSLRSLSRGIAPGTVRDIKERLFSRLRAACAGRRMP